MSLPLTNLRRVCDEIDRACGRANRDPRDVKRVVVTKGQSVETIRQLVEAGQVLFGENRLQEASRKAVDLPKEIEWHLIGHLQRNKARDAVRLFRWIHSVDSERLAEALEKEALKVDRDVSVLLQLNVSGEASKFGLAPEQAEPVLRAVQDMRRLKLRGLMTMAPLVNDPEAVRPVFRELRQLRDAWRQSGFTSLTELSMGMSQDFIVAVEEGATIVRVGSAIFHGE